MSDLVENPEDRFSQNEAHFITDRSKAVVPMQFSLAIFVSEFR